MAETTADVRREIELTRNRMSETLSQLEQKVNVMQIVRDHPWPALAVAVAAGAALAGTKADVKAAAATVGATKAVPCPAADAAVPSSSRASRTSPRTSSALPSARSRRSAPRPRRPSDR